MNNARWTVIALISLTLFGCQNRKQGTVIARVGSAELTMEEARSAIDTSLTASSSQLQRYVAHWVNEQLLSQEAVNNGFEKREDIQDQIRTAHRQFLAQAYLQQKLSQDSAMLAPQDLAAYYKQHAQEFFIREDMIRLNLLTFSTRERASMFAASVAKGAAWSSALDQILRDSMASKYVITVISGRVYSQHTLYPSELWKVARSLGTNESSFPVSTESGYTVLQVLAAYQRGTPAPYELVQDEVRERVLLERRQKVYNDLLGTLRSKYSVELMMGPASTDTTESVIHE
ncbi:MAG TPA: peptidyl-prolyl cis-trans isomerase [Bacteroidota bacterium]|nr:peptidyl-prolyl cis-trans isomerase [Bacteroidota bacterium]